MKDTEYGMQGSYSLVLKNTPPSDVFKVLRSEVDALKQGEEYYDHLLENMTLDYANNDSIVTLLWNGEEDQQKHFISALQARFAPDQTIHTTTLIEDLDGSWRTDVGTLTDDDYIISDKY